MSTLIKDPLEKLAKKMEHNPLKFELKNIPYIVCLTSKTASKYIKKLRFLLKTMF